MKWTASNTLMKLYWIKQHIFLTLFDRPLHLHLRKWTYLLRKDIYAAFILSTSFFLAEHNFGNVGTMHKKNTPRTGFPCAQNN